MEIILTAADMQQAMLHWAAEGKKVGFVPTMGALHEGHLSLVRLSEINNDVTVVSVYVNPTQFNDKTDLEKYPRTLDSDLQLLSGSKNVVVFCPGDQEIYPDGSSLAEAFDLGFLEQTMEGKHRPGHFQGVVQVVKRLLELVPAANLYMGQKDFQQFTIIRHMLSVWNNKTKLIVCPIVREQNGLAMSSRNERLSQEARIQAGEIYRTLCWMKGHAESLSFSALIEEAIKNLSRQNLTPEYLEIVDATTLKPIQLSSESSCAVACIAVWMEGVRLIDNLILSGELPVT